jgi:hypothetical protein
MKAITIKQPWAQLICEGVKDIENRTWKTSYRGRVLIHTSAKPNRYPLDMIFTQVQLDEMLKQNTENYWCGHKEFGAKYCDSAIIGSVEIVDCVQNHSSVWAEKFTETKKCPNCGCEDCIEIYDFNNVKTYRCCANCKQEWFTDVNYYDKQIYNWVLENPVLFKNPILNVKGKLSFWESGYEVCHICGKPADLICAKCGEWFCSHCQTPYNQFTQINYDCCKSCDKREE